MKPILMRIERQHPWWHAHKIGRKYYELCADYTYSSELTGKTLTAKRGWISDGATMAFDVEGNDHYPPPWLPHDIMCQRGTWDDGSPVTREEAAEELYWLMIKVGCSPARANAWKWSTYHLGCQRVRNQ